MHTSINVSEVLPTV